MSEIQQAETFGSLVLSGLRKGCTYTSLMFLMIPFFSLLNPSNFPLFFTCQMIFWLVFYLPMSILVNKQNTTKKDADMYNDRLLSFSLAMGAYGVIYFIVMMIYLSYAGCSLDTNVAEILDVKMSDVPVEDVPNAVLNVTETLNSSWVA